MSQHIEILDELVTATRILVQEGIIDGFGHISVRNPGQLDHYFMLRDNSVRALDENQTLELDRDSNPVNPKNHRPSIERFIHGEIYRARPDVNAVVHTHAPSLIPFGVSKEPLRPLYHMCGFMAAGVPVFDIEHDHGITDLLVTNSKIGQSLSKSLGNSSLVLMRGHGATVVGTSIKEAVFRAIYATVNARLQPIALQLGEPKYLSEDEARKAEALHSSVLDRPWEYWKKKLN